MDLSFRILILLIFLYSCHSKANEDLETKEIQVESDPSQAQEVSATFAKEIYTEKDIFRSGSLNLFDFLSQYTSLNILPNYGDKTKPLIDMRGYGIEAGYQNVVINVDGQRINNIDLNPQMIGSIPISNIKNIEIIRGSGSVISGDGAMAGVINIVTKDVTDTSLNSTFGSDGQEIYTLNSGFGNDFFNTSIHLYDENLDGYSSPDTQNIRDEVNNTSQSIKLNFNPNNDLKINLVANSVRNNAYLVGPLTKNEFISNPKQNGGNQYNNYDYDIDKVTFNTNYTFNKNLSLDFNFFREDKSQHSITEWTNDTLDYDYEGFLLSIPIENNFLTIKPGIQVLNGERKDSVGVASKDNSAFFIETEISNTDWLSKNLIISAGFRYEEVNYAWNDGSSSIKNDENLEAWDIGLNYRLNNNWNIFSNYSHSFQSPDIDRLFSADYIAWVYSGRSFNGFISSAKADTFNIGINQVSNSNQLQMVFFYSDIQNEIICNPNNTDANGFCINENIDNSKKYGLEIFNQLKINDEININLAYSFIKAEIGSNSQGFTKGKDMPGVPQNTVIANLNYKFLSFGNLNLNHTWKERAYIFSDFDNNASQKQPPYISTNLSLNYNYKVENYVDSINISAGINNIFEHKNAIQGYVDSLYPFNFSRTWFAGLSMNF